VTFPSGCGLDRHDTTEFGTKGTGGRSDNTKLFRKTGLRAVELCIRPEEWKGATLAPATVTNGRVTSGVLVLI
jgi:hypothetical protein